MMTSPIVPAIIPTSFEDLESQIKKIMHLAEVHIDVVDGVFVPALSWPYTEENAIPARALSLLAPFSLEVDLMVEDQIGGARAWLQAGADQLVFHAEVITPYELEQFITEHDVTVGIAAGNDVPLTKLYEYFSFVDYVQVMGIKEIGTQGQPFDVRMFERIAELRKDFPAMPISVDGSMNKETLPHIAKLNLSRIIVGSAIMGQSDPLAAYHALTTLIQSNLSDT